MTDTHVLSATERRSLERLLKSDFEQELNNLDTLHNKALSDASKAHQKALKDSAKKQAAASRQAEAALAIVSKDVSESIKNVVAALADEGFRLDVRIGRLNNYNSSFNFDKSIPIVVSSIANTAAAKELGDRETAINAAFFKARETLKNTERETYRALLMNALTGEAVQGFLDSVPKASDLFKVTP